MSVCSRTWAPLDAGRLDVRACGQYKISISLSLYIYICIHMIYLNNNNFNSE